MCISDPFKQSLVPRQLPGRARLPPAHTAREEPLLSATAGRVGPRPRRSERDSSVRPSALLKGGRTRAPSPRRAPHSLKRITSTNLNPIKLPEALRWTTTASERRPLPGTGDPAPDSRRGRPGLRNPARGGGGEEEAGPAHGSLRAPGGGGAAPSQLLGAPGRRHHHARRPPLSPTHQRV